MDIVKQESMSSNEIASLTGKDHKNVIRDIEKLLVELGSNLSSPMFSNTYKDSNNIDRKCYNLPKRECLILVSGYNIKMRAAIIDRWQELEKGVTPLTKIEVARQYLASLEKLEVAEKEVEKLTIVLDKNHGWSSIKQQEMKNNVKYSWRILTAWHNHLGIERKDVFDQNYGTVKSYHAEAWLKAYNVVI